MIGGAVPSVPQCRNIVRFRCEIGQYVSDEEVARFERHVSLDRPLSGAVDTRTSERGPLSVFDRMKERWGVGFWGLVAILLAFSLAGMTTLRLKGPVMAFIMPATAPGWLQWAVYLVVMLPVYQVLLLAYGTLLGQFDFFWSKLKALGRLISRRPASASG